MEILDHGPMVRNSKVRIMVALSPAKGCKAEVEKLFLFWVKWMDFLLLYHCK